MSNVSALIWHTFIGSTSKGAWTAQRVSGEGYPTNTWSFGFHLMTYGWEISFGPYAFGYIGVCGMTDAQLDRAERQVKCISDYLHVALEFAAVALFVAVVCTLASIMW